LKKTAISLVLILFSGIYVFGNEHVLNGDTPGPISYVKNQQIVVNSIGLSGNADNYYNNFIDILPLHPDTGALDRTYWKLSGGTTLVSIPFHIYKSGTSNEIRAKGTSDTVTNSNVWAVTGRNSYFSYIYDFKIDSNANSFVDGTYTKTLRLRLWDNCTIGTWSSTKTKITMDITLSLVITGNSPSLSISVGSLSFGEVTTNTARTFTATISSGQPYVLSMVSANNFNLEYFNPASLQIEKINGENIAYQIVINGKTYSPTANPNSGVVANVPTVTTQVNDPYTGTITLKTVTATTAGDYKDTLTFTVAGQ
jgi:hypothetical protein